MGVAATNSTDNLTMIEQFDFTIWERRNCSMCGELEYNDDEDDEHYRCDFNAQIRAAIDANDPLPESVAFDVGSKDGALPMLCDQFACLDPEGRVRRQNAVQAHETALCDKGQTLIVGERQQ